MRELLEQLELMEAGQQRVHRYDPGPGSRRGIPGVGARGGPRPDFANNTLALMHYLPAARMGKGWHTVREWVQKEAKLPSPGSSGGGTQGPEQALMELLGATSWAPGNERGALLELKKPPPPMASDREKWAFRGEGGAAALLADKDFMDSKWRLKPAAYKKAEPYLADQALPRDAGHAEFARSHMYTSLKRYGPYEKGRTYEFWEKASPKVRDTFGVVEKKPGKWVPVWMHIPDHQL